MDHQKGLFYYRLNLVLFFINICIGVHLQNPLIVTTSLIAFALSVYVYHTDWSQGKTWLLDQIAILAILVPATVLWLQLNPAKHPFAGIFFGSAAIIYGLGLIKKLYTHSQKPVVREFWHLFVHILSFVGALFSSEILLIGLI